LLTAREIWNTDLNQAKQSKADTAGLILEWADAWRKYKMAESLDDAVKARRKLDRLESMYYQLAKEICS
jgi:hypothetical protein